MSSKGPDRLSRIGVKTRRGVKSPLEPLLVTVRTFPFRVVVELVKVRMLIGLFVLTKLRSAIKLPVLLKLNVSENIPVLCVALIGILIARASVAKAATAANMTAMIKRFMVNLR